MRVVNIDAVVHGSTGTHTVAFSDQTGYSCTCAHNGIGAVCGHVYAVELVCHALAPATRHQRTRRVR